MGKGRAQHADDESSSTREDVRTISPWEQAWDDTMNSSVAGRVKGVKALCSLLECYNPQEVLDMEQKFIDLASAAFTARRADKALETNVARTLSLVFLTLARNGQHAYDTLQPLLLDRAREGKAQGACARALAVGAASINGTDHDRLKALRSIAGLWLVTKGAELEAAIRSWMLVLTRVDVRTLSTPLIDTTLEYLSDFLGGTHVGVRAAAGEALGLLYTMCGLEVLPDDDDELLEASETTDSDSTTMGASIDASSCAVSEDARMALQNGLGGILARIEALSKNRGDDARRSKGDRRMSRRSAASTLAAMNSGGSTAGGGPSTVVRCQGHRCELSLHSQLMVYRELTSLLQGGFQSHMNRNPLLFDLLSLDLEEACVEMEKGGPGRKAKWRSADKTAISSIRAQHRASVQRMAAHMMDQ